MEAVAAKFHSETLVSRDGLSVQMKRCNHYRFGRAKFRCPCGTAYFVLCLRVPAAGLGAARVAAQGAVPVSAHLGRPGRRKVLPAPGVDVHHVQGLRASFRSSSAVDYLAIQSWPS